MKIEYLLVLAFSIAIPFAASFSKRIDMYEYKAAMVKAIALPSVVYLIWDVVATARGHWSFNPAYVVGIRIAGLPVEEVLFFPVISFITIFTWEAVKAIAHRRDQ